MMKLESFAAAAAAGVKSQLLAEAPGLATKTRLLKEPERRGETRRGPGGEPGCLIRHLSYLGGTPHLNQKEAEKSWLMISSKE